MKLRGLVLSALTMVSISASAVDTTALTSSRLIGNQSFDGVLGMDFDVLTPITVTKLGAFDSGQDGFAGTIVVGIFDRNTEALVGTSASMTGTSAPLDGSSRFVDVPDFFLPAGSYSVVAVGFSSSDRNGNVLFGGASPTVDTGGGAIGFVGTSRWGLSTTLSFPANPDLGPSNQYDAGTLQFTSAVPEVSEIALLLAGLPFILSFSALRRRVNSPD